MRLVVEGKPIQIFGDGLQLRDFNYVDDCVDAMLLAGAHPESNGKLYNLGSTEVISLKALAEELVGLAGDARYELVPFPPDRKVIDIGDYYGDHSLITSELGWQPRVPLRTGLQRTLAYYRQHAAHYWE
jgi:dTDP-glucose 4,6-dehydratase/UDP-glucose 4-epimerase